ncbi:MAG: Gfo/Idh/MocA family oxidoreductase, partial [Clostridiales bacterium]|nr:Gfo/Idh/MocA family oxidoreductase [Clostridiales bacterium]
MQKIRIGIIGTGMAWERLHRPAYERLGDRFLITAVCERDQEKAAQTADALGVPREQIYYDYKQMMQSAAFDALDIMVPIAKNYEITMAAIENNISFICEKPYAESPEKAKKLIAAAKGKELAILVAENFRYAGENIIIKNLLNQNAIGNVMYFIDNNVRDFYAEKDANNFSAKEWRQHPAFKGGVFLDSAVHHIARHRFLFGDVQEVFATGVPSKDDFCEYNCITGLLAFKNNITGHYAYFNQGVESQLPKVGLRIFGTDGEIYLEEKMCGCVNYTLKTGESKQIYYTPDGGYYNELVNFHAALTENAPVISTPEKELGDIETIFDILRAVETGEKVIASNH